MGSAWSSSKQISDVHVHFGGKKLRVTFSASDFDANKRVPLRSFRTKLAKALDVPATSLTLFQLNPQKKLANMGATLEDYGIKSGADILAVQAEPPAPKAPATASEQIDAIVGEVDTELGDRISRFTTSPPADFAERDKENRILCETVLAKTIALDNVEVENADDRAKRKQAIARLQTYHRNIDKAMAAAGTEASEASTDAPTPNTGTEIETETEKGTETTHTNLEASKSGASPIERKDTVETKAEAPQVEPAQDSQETQETQEAEPRPAAPKVKKNKKKNKKR